MEKTIEIPFGAKDSELKGWEYTIPENMEAEIKDGKIIVKQKESEDEGIRTRLIALVEAFGQGTYKDEMLAYLEKQKEQKPANSEKPKEWSEADKLHLNNAILVAKKEWGVNSYTARWLESLRDNYKKCNSHWKPSEEQMAALLNAEGLVRANNYPENAEILASLYEDLKKL